MLTKGPCNQFTTPAPNDLTTKDICGLLFAEGNTTETEEEKISRWGSIHDAGSHMQQLSLRSTGIMIILSESWLSILVLNLVAKASSHPSRQTQFFLIEHRGESLTHLRAFHFLYLTRTLLTLPFRRIVASEGLDHMMNPGENLERKRNLNG